MKCPICQRPMEREGNGFYPFCSERCKLVDLGKWLGEEYKIPAERAEPESDEEPILH